MDDHVTECSAFDFRKHITFDATQMELAVIYDVCQQHVTHFCMVHRCVYCVNHVSCHKGITLDQFVMNHDSAKLAKKFGALKDGIPIFWMQVLFLLPKQVGIDREKGKQSLLRPKWM